MKIALRWVGHATQVPADEIVQTMLDSRLHITREHKPSENQEKRATGQLLIEEAMDVMMRCNPLALFLNKTPNLDSIALL